MYTKDGLEVYFPPKTEEKKESTIKIHIEIDRFVVDNSDGYSPEVAV